MVPLLRCAGPHATHRHAPAGPRAVRLASDDAAGAGAPIQAHRVRRQDTARAAEGRGEGLPRRAALGVGGNRVPASHCRPDRSGDWACPGTPRTPRSWPMVTGADQRPVPVRGRQGDRRGRARLAAHPTRRQVGHRGHRPHPGPRRHRPLKAAGHGRRPLQARVQGLARRPAQGVAGQDRGRCDGRVHGFKTAAAEDLPDAVEDMDPFHVVRLAGDAMDRCRQRVQQESLGRRGRSGDPLYAARRTLHTGHGLLSEKQSARLEAAFAPTTMPRSKRPGASTSASSPLTARRTGPAGRP